METKKLAMMATFLTFLLCVLGVTTVTAQSPGTGVDPNVVMLDDFENGSTSKWAWKPFGRGEAASIELASAANGDPVRFGDYALKFNIDFTGAQPDQTLPANLSPGMSRPDIIIPGNDGSKRKRIGMWVYATPGVAGMWMRVGTRANGATSGVTNTDLASSINWIGWKYVQCDLPNNHEFHPDGIRFLVTKSSANYYVNGYVIIDNIRITDMTFSEDLTPPTISSLTGNGVNLTGTFTTSQIDLEAAFNDAGTPSSGINYNSICVIVDGYTFKAGDSGFTVNETENKVSLTGMNLSNGLHNITVHVEDNFGHITTKNGTITIDASDGKATTVEAAPAPIVEIGNAFEIKINTNNSKDIKELEVVLELDKGSIDAVNGVTFAASAQVESSYNFDPRSGYLTINLKNDVALDAVETLATINVDIPKNCIPTDVLRCSPVSSRAVYADNSISLFTLFDAFTKDITATYDFIVNKRVVGIPGEVLVTNLEGIPLSGATVYALSSDLSSVIASAVTGADGVASGMNFTNIAQPVNIYAEKDSKYSYTKLIRTLTPLLTNTPQYIRSGTTPDPKTSKTITWVTNPVQAAEKAIIKIAKKSAGESGFQQFDGTTKILEYNAVASSGVLLGNSVTVDNLEPGTDYIYQVGDGTTWSATREFTTTIDTNKFSFSAFGDLQASTLAMMDRLLAMGQTIQDLPEKPLFTLNVGDINDTDDRYDYVSFYGHLLDQRPGFANIDMISGYGNHEYMGNPDADNIKFLNGHHTVEPSASYDSRIVGTGSYATEYGNMIVINLDWEHKGIVSASTMLREQAKWLEEILSKSDKTWKIVSIHYPIYPNESTPGSKAILGPVFDKYNVQMLFCGHGHTFERVQVREGNYLAGSNSNKRTFTPETGGTIYFQLGDSKVTNAQGRWIFCEVDGKKMEVTVRDANNNVVDNESFTLYASAINNYAVNFNTVDTNGTLTATVDGNVISSGDQIDDDRNIIFTATPNSGYRIKEWKYNNTVVNETNTTYSLSNLNEAATVTVEFQLDDTGLEENFAPSLNVYPNPFTDALQISGAENCRVSIMDIAGSLVDTHKIKGNQETIDLGQLSSGVYLLNIEKDNQTKVIKVIKK